VAYTYTSSNTAVATVSTAGVVTAVAPGTSTITVAAAGTGTGLSTANLTTAATITVSERAPGLTSLQVSPTSASLAIGGTQRIKAVVQGPRASAATYSYGSNAPTIATVTGSGDSATVTAVAPGTAVITATAQSTQEGAFSASSITALIAVTVSPQGNVTIQTVTQGPIRTTANDGGIVTARNENVNQPVDITNVRDQIQVVANLQPNGQRIDSVVAWVAEADGSNRLAAARQIFSNGVANAGDITLFINTADFVVDWATPAATTRYKNGQKQISVSVFGPTGEIQSAQNNRQTVNFSNLDGWTARMANPTRSATRVNSTGTNLTWWGGPGTEGQGSYSVAAVVYTPNRAVTTFRTGMMAGTFPLDALGTGTEVCAATRGGNTGRGNPIGESFGTASSTVAGATLTYNSANGAASAGSGVAATTGNSNIECGEYQLLFTDGAANQFNFPGVLTATDNNNNTYPRVQAINGYRTSATVPQMTGNRLDYLGPASSTGGVPITSATFGGNFINEPDIRRTVSIQTGAAPMTGWINESFSINAQTAANVDNGVGVLGTAASQRATRAWFVYGCGVELENAIPFDGTGATLRECADDFDSRGGYDAGATPSASLSIKTRGPYQVYYTEPDLLGNVSNSADYIRAFNSRFSPSYPISARFGVDRTKPMIRFASTGVLDFNGRDTIVVSAANVATALQAEFFDARSGFIDAGDADNIVRLFDEALQSSPSSTSTTVALTRVTNSLGGAGLDIPTFRSQQHFLSQAAGYLNAANFPTRARCTEATSDLDDATADVTEQQYTFLGFPVAQGNSIKATGADVVTNPSCAFRNALAIQGDPLADGYRPGMMVAIPEAGAYRYSTRVYDRAGNVSDVITRWVVIDAPNSAPVAQLGTLLSVAQGGDESFPLISEDRSEVRGANIQVSYPGVGTAGAANIGYLVYPKQLLDARFNNTINSPSQTTISTPGGAAFVSALEFTNAGAVTSATDINKPTLAQSHVFDVRGSNMLSTQAILGTALANPTDWSTWIAADSRRAFNSFSVLSTLDAGFNAGTGLKAQVVAPSNAINAPFTRVEFYRLTSVPAGTPEGAAAAREEWQYIGSSTTAIPGDGGTVRYWTYLIGAYANSPYDLATTQRSAQTADVIMAVGVRGTGEGLASVGTIGGNILNLTVAGLPAGAAANVTINNPSTAYVATFTAGGSYVLPSGSNTYNVLVANTTFNNIQYVGTASPASFTSSSNISAVTVTYRANVSMLTVTTAGLINGAAPYAVNGPTPATTTVISGTQGNGTSANLVVPAAGEYQIVGTAGSYGTAVGVSTSFAYTVSAAATTTTAPGTPGAGTITYTNTTPFMKLGVSGVPAGASAAVSTVCAASPAVSTTDNVTDKLITAALASDVCTTTAPFISFGGSFYFSTVSGTASATAAATVAAANGTTVTYGSAVAPRIRITTASAVGAGNNLPDGLSFTVRVTSSAYTGVGFQDFTCTTGTPCDIAVTPGTTYNVSFNRRLESNNQRWHVPDAASVAASNGTVSITGASGSDAAGNALVNGVTASTTPTAATDVQRTIVITYTGPNPIP
jgi:hypothetical protein